MGSATAAATSSICSGSGGQRGPVPRGSSPASHTQPPARILAAFYGTGRGGSLGPPRQSWGRGPPHLGGGGEPARRSTCLLLLAVQRRRVESLVLGALSSSPVHRALVLVLGTNIAVLLDCSKSSRQCSLPYLLTYLGRRCVSVNGTLLLTGVRHHPPGRTDETLCRCFGAPACRVFRDHLIMQASGKGNFATYMT